MQPFRPQQTGRPLYKGVQASARMRSEASTYPFTSFKIVSTWAASKRYSSTTTPTLTNGELPSEGNTRGLQPGILANQAPHSPGAASAGASIELQVAAQAGPVFLAGGRVKESPMLSCTHHSWRASGPSFLTSLR
eukprot:1142942-Pelagomonas_calceolata.AAC.8